MRILITGASGFLGRNFLLSCPDTWDVVALYRSDESFADFVRSSGKRNVRPVQCDLTSAQETAELADRYGRNWDVCLYLAARVDIPWSVKNPAADLTANTIPLIHLGEHTQVSRLVYFSSGAVYDGLTGEATPDTPVNPTLPYAVSKLACERYVDFFRVRRGSVGESMIVRFFGAYGPWEAPHKIYTRLIRAFAVERSRSYTIYGDGLNLIDAMYVDDAVAAVHRIIAGNRWNTIVNLAAGNPVTIEHLVRESAKALGAGDVEIRKEGTAHESNQFQASICEMREWYGFTPAVDLATGMRRFRDFYVDQVKGAVTHV